MPHHDARHCDEVTYSPCDGQLQRTLGFAPASEQRVCGCFDVSDGASGQGRLGTCARSAQGRIPVERLQLVVCPSRGRLQMADREGELQTLT